MNSNVRLQELVDDAASLGDVAPALATGGVSDGPALSIATDVMQAMINGGPAAQPYNWKWNRFNVTPFPTNSLQQDYFVPGVVNLGWLESCWAVNINQTTIPKEKRQAEVKKDLEVTHNETGYPGKICWLPNDQLLTGIWETPVAPQETPPYTTVNNATGTILRTASNSISGQWQYAIRWYNFNIHSGAPLPSDARVIGIYPVVISTHTYTVNTGAIYFKFGENVSPWVDVDLFNLVPGILFDRYPNGGFDPWGVWTDGITWDKDYAGLNRGIGTDVSKIADQAIYAENFQTMNWSGMNDLLNVTAVGYAIYYDSATPFIDNTIPLPYSPPPGEGVAWVLPSSVEIGQYNDPKDARIFNQTPATIVTVSPAVKPLAPVATAGLRNPGPGVVYINPIGAVTAPDNPITAITDYNGNLWVLTTYGTCGATEPLWPTDITYPTILNPDAVATTVQDGTCVWTAINPSGQGFRLNPIPGRRGTVWLIHPVAQKKAPRFRSIRQYLEPIPDDFATHFKQGFFAECFRRHPDPKVRAKYPLERQLFLEALDKAVRQADREMDDAGFYPGESIMASGVSMNSISPAYPYGPWS